MHKEQSRKVSSKSLDWVVTFLNCLLLEISVMNRVPLFVKLKTNSHSTLEVVAKKQAFYFWLLGESPYLNICTLY